MAKAGAAKTPTTPKAPAASKAADKTPSGFQEPTTGGTVKHNPPIEGDKAMIEKAKAEIKAKDDAAKAAKLAEKEAKAAAKKAEQAEKAEARAKSKAEREARLAEAAAGKNYTGSMLALADRVKQNVYIKGTTGQLRSNDELAQALDGVQPTDVIRIGLDLLKIEDNPYTKLNVGQQSMNLRNRMRGAIKKEALTVAAISEYITRNNIHVITAESVAEAKAAKAKRVADAAAAKEAKAKADADKAVPAAKSAEAAAA